MKSHITVLLTALCLFASCLATAFAEDIAIQPEDIVIISKNPKLKGLAEDFALHLKLIGGKDIAVNPAAMPPNAFVFMLDQQPGGEKRPMAPEEGRWDFEGRKAYFSGEGEYGAKHAVYAFLEDELGVRWPTGEEIVVKPMSPILVKRAHCSWIPKLKAREIRAGNGKGSNAMYKLWQERLRWGLHDVPPFGHAFTQWWNRYGKTHPEYMALNNGKRFPVPIHGKKSPDPTIPLVQDAQMMSICPSNPDVPKVIVKEWNKKSAFINICENDAPASLACHCDACIALDPHPSQILNNDMGADRYIVMAKRVLEEARKYKPDVRVSMYAYNASEQPPVNVRLDPDIVLGIVPTDFRMASLDTFVGGWAKMGMTEFKYRPNRHHYFCPMGFPLGCERYFFDVFQLMRKLGAASFDYDAPAKYDIFRWHGDYILQHAMTDPDKPFEYWEKDFADAYADAASQEILDYFRFWMAVWKKSIEPELELLCNRKNWSYFSRSFVKSGAVGGYYSLDDFAASGKLLAKALAKPGLSDGARRRITALQQFHDHAALMLKAIQTSKFADITRVVDFRKQHGMPETMPYEKEYGDFCGLKIDRQILDIPGELLDTPIFWHARVDWFGTGEARQWQAGKKLDKWPTMMPTDCSWEAPKPKRPYPTPEFKKMMTAYDGSVWYACKVKVPAAWKGRSTIKLHLFKVNDDATAWLNGRHVGTRECRTGDDVKAMFAFDIKDAIDWSKNEQTIVVKVTDYEGDGGIRGRVFLSAVK